MITELNGFDETGIIGRYLRFVRVGIRLENRLRPLVYNLLHFGAVTTTKSWLGGFPDDIKIGYVRMILKDPSIDMNHYIFSTDHQIDVLRKFTLLEGKQLFGERGKLIQGLDHLDEAAGKQRMWDVVKFLKRYERSPYWMESFVKSYGFRMVLADLPKQSTILKNDTLSNYRVESYVDGGFPFVFWWRTFLEEAETSGSRFSVGGTPIYGITKGDEYYPVTSMAGNVAYILNTVTGMTYPHAVNEVPEMPAIDLNHFYSEFAERTSVPTFQKRVLFIGRLERDYQYLIPLILHEKRGRRIVYEPFRLSYRDTGTFHEFYRVFGYYPQNDTVLVGKIETSEDKAILQECEDRNIEYIEASGLFSDFSSLMDEIVAEARKSNLTPDHVEKVERRVQKSKDRTQELYKKE